MENPDNEDYERLIVEEYNPQRDIFHSTGRYLFFLTSGRENMQKPSGWYMIMMVMSTNNWNRKQIKHYE